MQSIFVIEFPADIEMNVPFEHNYQSSIFFEKLLFEFLKVLLKVGKSMQLLDLD